MNINSRRVLEDNSMLLTSSAMHHLRDVYVADVCVRGGKWYWEVNFSTAASYVCIGMVTRSYRRPVQNAALGGDKDSASWGLQGPSLSYLHGGVARTPTPLPNKSASE